MIKLKAIKNFTLKDFKKIKIVERAGKEQEGWINKNDIFTCDIDMANYLLGNNGDGVTVVKVIEIIPKTKKTKKR